jgi:hypothetical protein
VTLVRRNWRNQKGSAFAVIAGSDSGVKMTAQRGANHWLNCMSKENATSRGRILLVDDDEGVIWPLDRVQKLG